MTRGEVIGVVSAVLSLFCAGMVVVHSDDFKRTIVVNAPAVVFVGAVMLSADSRANTGALTIVGCVWITVAVAALISCGVSHLLKEKR